MKKIVQSSEVYTVSCKLLNQFSLNLVCKVLYMESIKYVNLIEISSVVIEI